MKTCNNCIFYEKIDKYCKYFCDFIKEENANICEYYEQQKTQKNEKIQHKN